MHPQRDPTTGTVKLTFNVPNDMPAKPAIYPADKLNEDQKKKYPEGRGEVLICTAPAEVDHGTEVAKYSIVASNATAGEKLAEKLEELKNLAQ